MSLSKSELHFLEHRHVFPIHHFAERLLNFTGPEDCFHSGSFRVDRKLKAGGRVQRLELGLRLYLKPDWRARGSYRDLTGSGQCHLALGLCITEETCPTKEPPLVLAFRLGLLDKLGRDVGGFASSHSHRELSMTKRQVVGKVSEYTLGAVLKEKELVDEEGTLTVVCDLAIQCPVAQQQQQQQLKASLLFSEPSLETTMDGILGQGLFSDVVLVCQGREFPCHRAILAGWSEVFKTMFSQGNMQEVKTGTVVLKDTHVGTVGSFLRYLYTTKLETGRSLQELLDLLAMAHKYQVTRLVKEVALGLLEDLTADNVCAVFAYANTYEVDFLRDSAVAFMAKNFKQVRETTAWAELKGKNPEVQEAVMQRLCP